MQYEMNHDQLAKILEACQPIPLIALQCGTPMSRQENANAAWKSLGLEMGFDSNSIGPVAGKSELFFTATPI